ncbi:hypothetical protein SAMN05518865_12718 [Duganella sp. CF458]|uniref:hypothetical protein n=1 Tax=Duganella sp. CF458 TaxID=1884368 RepID=UPI0008E2DD05|nr:hypothetical protein [Duganella sp. CF458]SFG98768.1 hypothetical protein SAMN05518865_12718 [Duganella sp. CF458]
MKQYFAAAGLFVFAATAAAQSGTSADQSVVVPAQKQVNLERKLISPQEFYQYQGAYALSNGQTLTLSRGAVHLYAQVGHHPRQQILWQGDGKFIAADGSLDMNIVWKDDDTATGELNFSPSMAGHQPVHATLSIASR